MEFLDNCQREFRKRAKWEADRQSQSELVDRVFNLASAKVQLDDLEKSYERMKNKGNSVDRALNKVNYERQKENLEEKIDKLESSITPEDEKRYADIQEGFRLKKLTPEEREFELADLRKKEEAVKQAEEEEEEEKFDYNKMLEKTPEQLKMIGKAQREIDALEQATNRILERLS